MRFLRINVSGRGCFDINEAGGIRRCDMPETGFSKTWLFLGVSTHHWHTRITRPFATLWAKPELSKGGIVWDSDHGTTRTWGGNKLPRITSATFHDE